MKAFAGWGKAMSKLTTSPIPCCLNPHDAIIKVTAQRSADRICICTTGSFRPWKRATFLATNSWASSKRSGKGVTNLKRGDRVVVPFTIACGNCFFCQKKLWSACDNTNPNAHLMEKAYGYSGSGLFGYSHMMGGYAGGQAQYVRVPFANVGPLKIRERSAGREGAVSFRYFSYRLYGCGKCADSAGRYGGGLGLRSGRANSRLPARSCWEPRE